MGNANTTKSQPVEDRDTNASKDRLSEATSDKTVSDLAESEKSSDSNSSEPPDQSSIPSPDGSPDPDGSSGRADGSDTGGPM
jgi:hypothetical protein